MSDALVQHHRDDVYELDRPPHFSSRQTLLKSERCRRDRRSPGEVPPHSQERPTATSSSGPALTR